MKPEDQMREAWDNAILPNTAIVRLAFEDGYRAAEKALAHRDAQPAVEQGEPVGHVVFGFVSAEGDCRQELVLRSNRFLPSGTLVYTEAPSVAVNEQFLNAARRAVLALAFLSDYLKSDALHDDYLALSNAIAAAEAAKGGV